MISEKSTILAIIPPERVLTHTSEHMDETAKSQGLHLTLANLGDLKEEDAARCVSVLYHLMKTLKAINIKYTGEGLIKLPDSRFAVAMLVSGKGLDVWRYEIAKTLSDEGLLVNEIDAFLPHMTIGFSDENKGVLPASFGFKEFTADNIVFMRGSGTRLCIYTTGKEESDGRSTPT